MVFAVTDHLQTTINGDFSATADHVNGIVGNIRTEIGDKITGLTKGHFCLINF